MARPISGSTTSAPIATAKAEAMTARLTYASARAWAPSATSAGLSSRRPARVRMSAATQLPAKPIAPASASAVEVIDRLRIDQAGDRLVAGDARADEDHGDDGEPGEPLAAGAAQRERDAERDRGGGVAGVVDQVGEQRDRAGGDEDQRLRGRGEPEHEQRERHRAHALVRALDRVVDEPVAVAAGPVVVSMRLP